MGDTNPEPEEVDDFSDTESVAHSTMSSAAHLDTEMQLQQYNDALFYAAEENTRVVEELNKTRNELKMQLELVSVTSAQLEKAVQERQSLHASLQVEQENIASMAEKLRKQAQLVDEWGPMPRN